MSAPSVQFVAVDLDDTLYPQRSFLLGAVDAVATRAQELGIDRRTFADAFIRVLESGSDTGHTIDETLARLGFLTSDVDEARVSLVETFRNYRPLSLECYDGVTEGLASLSRRTRVACLTDGHPDLQRAKIEALGLVRCFDTVVITDELGGRSSRKPSPMGLDAVAASLGLETGGALVVGDRVDKDVALARLVGVPVVRVRQGEYQGVPSPLGVVTVENFPQAVALVIAKYLTK